jgi:hypothetical protein
VVSQTSVIVVQEAKCSWLVETLIPSTKRLCRKPLGLSPPPPPLPPPLHGTRLACTSRNHAIILLEPRIVAVVGEVNPPTPHTFLVHLFERESSSSSGFPFAHTVCMLQCLFGANRPRLHALLKGCTLCGPLLEQQARRTSDLLRVCCARWRYSRVPSPSCWPSGMQVRSRRMVVRDFTLAPSKQT